MNFKRLAALAVGLLLFNACSNAPVREPEPRLVDLIIGTYSQDGSEGVYAAQFNIDSGEISQPRLALKSVHPTFLAVADSGVIYGAMRDPGGVVTAFRPVGKQDFTVINAIGAQGDGPCYLAFSPNNKYIASANYGGGNLSIFEIEDGGGLKQPVVKQHHGRGPHKRQEAPHVHWVQWSPYHPQYLYAVDLGLDQVKYYAFDEETGRIGQGQVAFQSPSGEGPRHMVFHPQKRLAYIMHELASKVHIASIKDDGSFETFGSVSTTPEGFTGENNGAHITITKDGKRLYTSNRGMNSIAIFDIDESGMATLRETVSTGGNWPRFFKLFEEYGFMLVANRHSGDITVFKVEADGSLTKTDHKATVPHPTFVDQYSN